MYGPRELQENGVGRAKEEVAFPKRAHNTTTGEKGEVSSLTLYHH